ncbi:hypothetical protein IMZ48_39505 [Candidatus Bathyarchaeota archaeon]|nr:hypothetical protein [Candidatus Bathyarchaeota archaeon]
MFGRLFTARNRPGGARQKHVKKHAREWTFVHSHFAAMGGFAFEIKNEDRNFFPVHGSSGERPTRLTITNEGLLFLEEHRPELVPDLTRTWIEDKSKGSILAKSIVCLQGSYWPNLSTNTCGWVPRS